MAGELTATALTLRRQWPLWLILPLAVGWIGVAAAAGGSPAAVAAAVLPPAIVVLFVAATLRSVRRAPGVEALETRLATVQGGTDMLGNRLYSLEQTLQTCLDLAARLATLAGTDALPAVADRLAAAAGDVRRSGESAAVAAERVAATLPALSAVNREIAGVAAGLGEDTSRRVEAIAAMLATVRARGDEVAVQADAAIASLSRQLAEIDEASRATTSRIAKRAYALDAAVDGAAARAVALLDGVVADLGRAMTTLDERLAAARGSLADAGDAGAAALGRRLDALLAAGGRVTAAIAAADDHSRRLHGDTDAFLDRLPARLAAAHAAGAAALGVLDGAVDGVAARVAGLGRHLGGSEATVDALGDRLDRLTGVAATFAATLASAVPAAAADLARLDAGTQALTGGLAGVAAEIDRSGHAAREVAALVGATRRDAAALGDDDLRLVDDRMHATAAVLGDIGRQIAGHAALSGETRAAIAADIAELDRQLRAAYGDGSARVKALGEQIAVVQGAAGGLATPLGEARALAGATEAQVAQSGVAAAEFGVRLERQLATLTEGIVLFREQGSALAGETAALAAATTAGGTALDAAAARLARERATFAAAQASLGSELDRLRAEVAALDGATRHVSDGAAADLVAAFAHADKLAATSADGLRALLATVVDDAGHAFAAAGAAGARAFGDPVRAELAAVDAAAERAAQAGDAAGRRIAGQVRTLETALAEVDAKIAETTTQLDVRARDTLAARSARLLEMLGDASVDVARLLAIDAGEDAWVRYLKGDRSVFARRMVRLVDRDSAARIARHFAHDRAFHDEASHYLDLFERLSRRLLADPDGEALLATVVASDFGKLYVTIARATGRWSPTA